MSVRIPLWPLLLFTVLITGISTGNSSPAQAQPPAPAAAAPAFFTALRDVPLMPGLEEMTEFTVVFDKPEGRIIESLAVAGTTPPEAIRNFYDTALPQFGWRRIAQNSFVREKENLQIHFEEIEGQNILRITVLPYKS